MEEKNYEFKDYFSNTMLALSIIGSIVGIIIAYRMGAKWWVYVLLWFVGSAAGGAIGRLIEPPKAYKKEVEVKAEAGKGEEGAPSTSPATKTVGAFAGKLTVPTYTGPTG